MSHPPFTDLDAKEQQHHQTLSVVQSLRNEVGPCPRDMIDKVFRPVFYDESVRSALDEYEDMSRIIALVRNASRLSNEDSHAIVLVGRVGPILESSFGDDKFFVGLKTRDIYHRVMDKFLSLELGQAKQLFRACLGMGVRCAVFAGHLFEGLAIRYTSGDPSGQTVFRRFGLMTRAKFPIRYSHRSPGHELTVVVDGGRSAILKSSPLNALEELSAHASDQQMPWSPRQRFVYREAGNISVNGFRYYLPDAPNNPLFDAFFYQVLHNKVVLWVLHMTIQRDPDGSNMDFAILDNLKRQARQAWPDLPVEVKYVLLVAYRSPG